ncbi:MULTISPECIES: hypothetical protein [Oscillatoriales]|nr:MULTISPECIES: hypothetical protein [Oscillatoriales]
MLLTEQQQDALTELIDISFAQLQKINSSVKIIACSGLGYSTMV